MWVVAAVAAAVTLLTGTLSPDGALDVLVRLWPVLLFLVAVTVGVPLVVCASILATSLVAA